MARTFKFSFDQTVQALKASAGVIQHAANALKVSRHSLENRIVNDPRLAKALEDIKEKPLDIAEGNVMRALEAGDGRTTRWYLDRKGRSRGYGVDIKMPSIPD